MKICFFTILTLLVSTNSSPARQILFVKSKSYSVPLNGYLYPYPEAIPKHSHLKLAPWYTYWPAEAMNQPIAPMSFPFWPGQNYQAPPANQPGNGQFQNISGHPNFYFSAPNQYIYPAR